MVEARIYREMSSLAVRVSLPKGVWAHNTIVRGFPQEGSCDIEVSFVIHGPGTSASLRALADVLSQAAMVAVNEADEADTEHLSRAAKAGA